MYSWHRVARRTERVYSAAAASRRDDSMAGRLRRYHRCGAWFGKICCGVAVVDWIYWRALQWLRPDASVERAADFPLPAAARPTDDHDADDA